MLDTNWTEPSAARSDCTTHRRLRISNHNKWKYIHQNQAKEIANFTTSNQTKEVQDYYILS